MLKAILPVPTKQKPMIPYTVVLWMMSATVTDKGSFAILVVDKVGRSGVIIGRIW